MNTDTVALLDKHFDLAVNAPDGIKRLREMILTLAMQGKLVPQDPKDQSASELLNEIEAEKKRLVKEGKIKEPKPLPPIKPEEVPYEVPEGWQWVRIRDVGHDWGQKEPQADFTYIDVGAIDNTLGKVYSPQVLSSKAAPSRARKVVRKGTVIYSTVRPYLLNIAVIENDYSPEPIASTAFAIIHPYVEISNWYIYHYLHSQSFIRYVESTMKGVAYPAINDGDFFQALIPLPPLAEQRRIVAKIDELMARVDELERMRDARNEKALAMHQAAIARLLDAGDANASRSGRDFIFAHFGELYGTKENVAEFRKAILQLAVMGRLVPQDNSEIEYDYSELLQYSVHKQHSFPENWLVIPLDRLGVFAGGGTPSKSNPDYWNGSIPWVSPKDMKRKFIDDAIDHISKAAVNNSAVKEIPVQSLLIVVRGMILAHTFPVAITTKEVTINQDMKAIVINQNILIEYLYLVLKGSESNILSNVTHSTHGTCKLEMDFIAGFHIPLPPLAEQKRIVAKVDELMALCDKLDKQIDERTAKESALLEAVAALV